MLFFVSLFDCRSVCFLFSLLSLIGNEKNIEVG